MTKAVRFNPFERRHWSPTLQQVDRREAFKRQQAAREALKRQWFQGEKSATDAPTIADVDDLGNGWGKW